MYDNVTRVTQNVVAAKGDCGKIGSSVAARPIRNRFPASVLNFAPNAAIREVLMAFRKEKTPRNRRKIITFRQIAKILL